MKKIKNIFIVLILSLSSVIVLSSSAQAGDLGLAVVDPSTGKVHGVIVASNTDPFNTGGILPGEYMGCVDCKLVPQTTADSRGNVAGYSSSSDGSVVVTYNSEDNTYTYTEKNVTYRDVQKNNTETTSERVTIDTKISEKVFKFGFQNLLMTNDIFQIEEISPAENTSVELSAKKEIVSCIIGQSYGITSQPCNIDSNFDEGSYQETLEYIAFSERKTIEQVEQEAYSQNFEILLNKMQSIIQKLEKWLKRNS